MRFELTREFLDDLIEIINNEDSKKAFQILEELYAADIAEIYNELNIEQNKHFKTYGIIVRVIYFPFGLLFSIITIIYIVTLCATIF